MIYHKSNNRKQTKGRATRLQTIEYIVKEGEKQEQSDKVTNLLVEVPAAYSKDKGDGKSLESRLIRAAYMKTMLIFRK